MKRTLCLSLTLLAAQACGTAAPAPPASQALSSGSTAPEDSRASTAGAAANGPGSTDTAAPASSDVPAAQDAPADSPPKPPAASTTHKAVLKDQVKGTPLAVLYLTDAAAATCGDTKPADGATMLELSLYWTPGVYSIGSKTKSASIRVRELSGGKWKTLPDVVKGQVQVREAPVEPGKIGRIHMTGDGGGQPIDEELDVLVCVPFEPPKQKGH